MKNGPCGGRTKIKLRWLRNILTKIIFDLPSRALSSRCLGGCLCGELESVRCLFWTDTAPRADVSSSGVGRAAGTFNQLGGSCDGFEKSGLEEIRKKSFSYKSWVLFILLFLAYGRLWIDIDRIKECLFSHIKIVCNLKPSSGSGQMLFLRWLGTLHSVWK